MVERVSSLEELLHRSAGNRFKAVQIDHRSHLALELIADTLIALLAELQTAYVTCHTQSGSGMVGLGFAHDPRSDRGNSHGRPSG